MAPCYRQIQQTVYAQCTFMSMVHSMRHQTCSAVSRSFLWSAHSCTHSNTSMLVCSFDHQHAMAKTFISRNACSHVTADVMIPSDYMFRLAGCDMMQHELANGDLQNCSAHLSCSIEGTVKVIKLNSLLLECHLQLHT